VVQNYLVSKRLYLRGGLCSACTKDSEVDIRTKIAEKIKSELDEMFSKMETEQTSEDAQNILRQLVAADVMATRLMDFQTTAVTWMIDREIGKRKSPFYEERVERGQQVHLCSVTNSSSPIAPESTQGGILADDMGLGKTLSALSLVAAMKFSQRACKSTLVICPLSVMSNWCDQVNLHFKHGFLRAHVHHGSSRDSAALDAFDVVISS
jgi:SWI/SNF related-matrix-associated actin-dependent regulator of chromatin subfamily C